LKKNYIILSVCISIFFIFAFSAFIAGAKYDALTAPDSKDFLLLADSIATGNGYYHDGQPEIFRAPGYPLFLAPFRYFFPNSVYFPVIIQILLAGISIFLLWKLTKRVVKEKKTADYAVCFYLFQVVTLVAANKILSDSLFSFLFILTLLNVEKTISLFETSLQQTEGARGLKNPYISAVICTLLATLCVFVRPIFFPIFPLLTLYFFIRLYILQRSYKRANSTKTLTNLPTSQKLYLKITTLLLLFILPFILITGGWCLRNKTKTGYSGFSSVSSINLYRYYACQVEAKQKGITFGEQQAYCDKQLSRFVNQEERAKYAIKQGLATLKAAPFRFLYYHITSDIYNLFPAIGDLYKLFGVEIGGKGTLSVINSQGIIAGVKHYFAGYWSLFFLAIPLLALLGIKYLFALIGSFRTVKPHINITLLLYALIIIYLLLASGVGAHPRFRVPVEPLLSIFAALGFRLFLAKILLVRKKTTEEIIRVESI